MSHDHLTALGHPAAEIKFTLDKPVTFRRKLSPKHLGLSSGYRTTAWAEVRLPWSDAGRFPRIEIARFHSSTPGQVEVFASQTERGLVSEITETEFFRLLSEVANEDRSRANTEASP